jgi:hypothetical protein
MYSKGFYPNYIKFGVGITASGDFGVVKFGGGVAGYLYFGCGAKVPTYRAKARPASTKPLLLIENNPKPEHLAYAKKHGIEYSVQKDKYGIIGDAIYRLNHWAFRQGLKRSARMSTWFADRASRVHIGKWKIHEVRPYFELSIGANLKLVSINGWGGVEFSFYNGNF